MKKKSWTLSTVRSLLREAAFDPKTDDFWKIMTNETHYDAHKVLAVRAIMDLAPFAGREENYKNLIFAIRHLVIYWTKLYDVQADES